MPEKTIVLIAGSGPTPARAVAAVKAAGHRVVAISIREAGGSLPKAADVKARISLLHGASIMRVLEENRCDGVLFVGKFDKGLHGMDLSQIDEVSGAMLARLPGRADMDIAAVVLEELQSRGFPPVSQLLAFAKNVTPQGSVAGPELENSRQSDIEMGLKVARAMADMDVGQTVVVKQGLVVAVEAAEHSDQCIRRAGALAKGGLCVVKVARPDQDFRFDTPVVGSKTLRTMHRAGADLLAVEAGRSLIMDRNFNDVAQKLSICVIGV